MAKKIDMTKKAKELMKSPERIRNIGTVAHIDHGKCVGPQERISLHIGENMEAKNLYEKYKDSGTIERETEKETAVNVKDEEIYINSLDEETGEVTKGKITKLWKMKKTDPLVEISLHNGTSVKTTPEHKFLILKENGQFSYKRADEIERNNVVVAVRKLTYDSQSIQEIKVEILEKLSEELKFYVNIGDDLKGELHEKVLDKGRKKVWEEINSPLKWKSFYHNVWRGQYRLRDLVKTAKIFNKNLVDVYGSIKSLNFRGTSQRGVHSSVDIELPQNNEEFNKLFWLVGMFFGDGCPEGNISNVNEEIQQRVSEICGEVLNVETHVRRYGDKCPRIDLGAGLTFMNFLKVLFDLPQEKKSKNISISGFLEKCPMELITSFLRGYFDADGTVEKGRPAVSVTSASEGMLEDIQLLLYKFDIASKINWSKRTLYVSGRNSLEKFKNIGFSVKNKESRFQKLLNNSSVSNLDLVPIETSLVGLDKRKEISKSDILEASETSLSPRQSQILARRDTVFSKVDSIERSENEEYVYDFTVEKFHNFISEGIVIHNTTLTDNLLAGAGMISDELAGEQLFMDYDEQEQERGITIYSANVSMVHEFDEDYHLINLIDTPGHVDFGGDVTRAMRAVDGAVVVIDAVEGVMPQTETVLRQALKERVKPVLFINKVDRMINELELTPKEMKNRFTRMIADVNNLIRKYAEEDFEKWTVNVKEGGVAFGSALYNWALSFPYMDETGITFQEIIDKCQDKKHKELWKKAPLHGITLNMIIRHLPNPVEAQEYRIPKIWPGDKESEASESMRSCNPDGPLACAVTKIYSDPHAGNIATARVFSGEIEEGQDVYLTGQKAQERVQQVCIYKGQQRVNMEEIPAGNIIGIVGLKNAFSGETICDPDKVIDSFESIKHIFDAVVTKSIEAKRTQDLPKVIEFLREKSREDPTLEVEINQETGEHLVSGLGELHIQAKVERGLKEEGIDVETSPPIVVYRETVDGEAGPEEGKSPNKHNRFYLEVEPLPEEVYRAMVQSKITNTEVKKKDVELTEKLQKFGMKEDDAKGVEMVYDRCVLSDTTKGIQYLNETMELIKEAFENIVDEGPLSKEPCDKVLVRLVDVKLHEDAIHRGPSQVIPAVRHAITNAMLKADATLMEPKQVLRVSSPQDKMGDVMKEVQNRRGEVLNVESEEGNAILKVKLPVSEMFGFEGKLKSVTGGKGFYFLVDVKFENLPKNLLDKTVRKIRERKGMKEEIPEPE